MFRHGRRFACLALPCLLLTLAAVPARAQLAQASQTQLWALTLDSGGGSSASQDLAAHVAVEALSSGTMSSPHYTGVIGFLASGEPTVSSQPVVFGVQPGFGPVAGGTAISVSGLNFEKFGVAPSLVVTVGGQPATDLVVHSDSLITATTPPGAAGVADVVVSGSFGSATQSGAFIYAPAIVTTDVVPLGGQLTIRNYGSVGDKYWTFASLSASVTQTRYGKLLLGLPVFSLIPPAPYAPSDGIGTQIFTVPFDTALQGLVIHFQSLSITHLSPLDGTFTNASTTAIP